MIDKEKYVPSNHDDKQLERRKTMRGYVMALAFVALRNHEKKKVSGIKSFHPVKLDEDYSLNLENRRYLSLCCV